MDLDELGYGHVAFGLSVGDCGGRLRSCGGDCLRGRRSRCQSKTSSVCMRTASSLGTALIVLFVKEWYLSTPSVLVKAVSVRFDFDGPTRVHWLTTSAKRNSFNSLDSMATESKECTNANHFHVALLGWVKQRRRDLSENKEEKSEDEK